MHVAHIPKQKMEQKEEHAKSVMSAPLLPVQSRVPSPPRVIPLLPLASSVPVAPIVPPPLVLPFIDPSPPPPRIPTIPTTIQPLTLLIDQRTDQLSAIVEIFALKKVEERLKRTTTGTMKFCKKCSLLRAPGMEGCMWCGDRCGLRLTKQPKVTMPPPAEKSPPQQSTTTTGTSSSAPSFADNLLFAATIGPFGLTPVQQQKQVASVDGDCLITKHSHNKRKERIEPYPRVTSVKFPKICTCGLILNDLSAYVKHRDVCTPLQEELKQQKNVLAVN